jgi:hypothetical protein
MNTEQTQHFDNIDTAETTVTERRTYIWDTQVRVHSIGWSGLVFFRGWRWRFGNWSGNSKHLLLHNFVLETHSKCAQNVWTPVFTCAESSGTLSFAQFPTGTAADHLDTTFLYTQ